LKATQLFCEIFEFSEKELLPLIVFVKHPTAKECWPLQTVAFEETTEALVTDAVHLVEAAKKEELPEATCVA
jgi:hypothetical protein